MHPSLELRNVSRLPPRLRDQAIGALPKAGHSLANLAILGNVISKDLDPHHGRLLLPVFFFVLHNFKVPTPDGVEAYMNTTEPRLNVRVAWVFVAFQGLIRVQTFGFAEPEAFPDLWKRIWPWIEFFHGYWESLPCLPELEPPHVMYGLFTGMILKLRKDRRTDEIVDATPGVRTVLCRAWMHIIEAGNSSPRQHLNNISTFLRLNLEPSKPENFAELLEGVGDTFFDLASTIVKHLKLVVPAPNSPVSTTTYDSAPRSEACFPPAMRSSGMVAAVTTLLRAVSQSDVEPGVDSNHLMWNCFDVIGPLLAGPTGRTQIVEAFKAGLLPAILSAGMRNDMKLDEHLVFLLRSLLPGFMVYRSILARMDQYMYISPELEAELRRSVMSLSFKRSWTAFVSVVKARTLLLKNYEAPSFEPNKACDNLECGIIAAKDEFRRCSGCQTVYYCSGQCQIHDWRIGEHRRACQHFMNLHAAFLDTLSTRDRAFMRALLDDDYHRNKANILIRKVMTRINLSSDRFHVKYDYAVRDGGPEIPFVRLDVSLPSAGALREHLLCEEKSGGRVEMIMMLYDGVAELAEEFSGREESEELLAEVKERAGLLFGLPVQQIHV
ncbi:hypothetical protein B0H19DRAFT_1271854 [Mycena capillaripes]|nr:hypothetical protein B0H19DRAFT_1271854 [Mycena capillaripes]